MKMFCFSHSMCCIGLAHNHEVTNCSITSLYDCSYFDIRSCGKIDWLHEHPIVTTDGLETHKTNEKEDTQRSKANTHLDSKLIQHREEKWWYPGESLLRKYENPHEFGLRIIRSQPYEQDGVHWV